MSIFGWDLPPGCTQQQIDEAFGGDRICECCGQYCEDCICPECPTCGKTGNPKCYVDHDEKGHGLSYSIDQRKGQSQRHIEQLEQEIDNEKFYLEMLETRKINP